MQFAKPTYSILAFVVGTGQFPRSFHLLGRYMTWYEKNLKILDSLGSFFLFLTNN